MLTQISIEQWRSVGRQVPLCPPRHAPPRHQHMHTEILDQVLNEEILKIFVQNKPRILEFGGSFIKAFIFFR